MKKKYEKPEKNSIEMDEVIKDMQVIAGYTSFYVASACTGQCICDRVLGDNANSWAKCSP